MFIKCGNRSSALLFPKKKKRIILKKHKMLLAGLAAVSIFGGLQQVRLRVC